MQLILPSESSATLAATKVEVKMKKAEPQTWAKLERPRHLNKPRQTQQENDQNIADDVDAIDLSDL